ncbi:hypothetical protein [Francisella philomiragia]|uniref:hypothetical protein n=1 Tax=Francisella philomiragia TaxID=28110 RepID=UPI001907B705|nr:hypothetical protein [Francisella philomiragia]MBK2093719.1 hypothetical protein [Francisella philomiragia]MBK2256206.1 hypothetical protein [Francisella philomiragia]MBK2268864.1 hypothetical protein [Francisella philomiragia]MBK2270661.1 hypothetical protein [Francisella philomiragia]MBK2274441.1 hypothetical protein [Francisella philomiragia]
MKFKKIVVLLGGFLLGDIALNAANLEVTKSAGNLSSSMVPGVANDSDTTDEVSNTTTDTTSAPTIEDTRAALIASGDIVQQAIPTKSLLNDQKSYLNEEGTHGFEWVGTPEEGHLEIAAPDGSRLALELPEKVGYRYSWGDRYWGLKDAEGNSYSINLHDNGSIDAWLGSKNVYSNYDYEDPAKNKTLEKAPQGFQDLFTAIKEE